MILVTQIHLEDQLCPIQDSFQDNLSSLQESHRPKFPSSSRQPGYQPGLAQHPSQISTVTSPLQISTTTSGALQPGYQHNSSASITNILGFLHLCKFHHNIQEPFQPGYQPGLAQPPSQISTGFPFLFASSYHIQELVSLVISQGWLKLHHIYQQNSFTHANFTTVSGFTPTWLSAWLAPPSQPSLSTWVLQPTFSDSYRNSSSCPDSSSFLIRAPMSTNNRCFSARIMLVHPCQEYQRDLQLAEVLQTSSQLWKGIQYFSSKIGYLWVGRSTNKHFHIRTRPEELGSRFLAEFDFFCLWESDEPVQADLSSISNINWVGRTHLAFIVTIC
ncbi:hypothetical protein NPIL_631001 [Nephila pilipes]|uniref:Uncharacterized protein n=1 Tax=Nephila pilipes TaxID=299642 RepID=A0A8X6QXI6_NEPPI|nr:hypothetical protein NPIL_631001 [Nephila pilipes]